MKFKGILGLGAITLSLFFLGSAKALGAGPELVEVISVTPITEVVCPFTPIGGSCTPVMRYHTVFKRTNGTSGEVSLTSWTTARKLLINFCPTKQGQLEKPCPTAPIL